MLSEKNIREKEFHNRLQSKSKGRFENIFYKAIYNANEDFFDYLKAEIFPLQYLSLIFLWVHQQELLLDY